MESVIKGYAGLPEQLRRIYTGRLCGLLHFAHGQERITVRFVNGHVVSGLSSLPEGRLGETMVRSGLLRQADLDRALPVVSRERKRLGVVLRDMGLLDKDHLEEAVGLHVRELLFRAFSWSGAGYDFEEGDGAPPPEEDLTLRLSTGELILEAVRRIPDLGPVRAALGNLDCVLMPSSDPLLRFQRVALSPADGYVLSRVDGTLSAREILAIAPLQPEQVERSLLGLLCTGMVEPMSIAHPAPLDPSEESLRRAILEAYEGLPDRNHFQALGVEPTTPPAEVKVAYLRLVKQFHPDVHHRHGMADLTDKIDAVFMRICRAYEVLRSPESRARYEASLRPSAPRPALRPVPKPQPAEPMAVSVATADVSRPVPAPPPAPARPARPERVRPEQVLAEAEALLAQAQLAEAMSLLEVVINKAEGEIKQLARFRLAEAHLRQPNGAREAEAQLRALVREDPRNAEAVFTLGTLYKKQGLASRASAMFERVLQVKPQHKAAQAELAALNPAPEPSASGFFARVLRRAV